MLYVDFVKLIQNKDRCRQTVQSRTQLVFNVNNIHKGKKGGQMYVNSCIFSTGTSIKNQ